MAGVPEKRFNYFFVTKIVSHKEGEESPAVVLPGDE
jgi:hypothetical protein